MLSAKPTCRFSFKMGLCICLLFLKYPSMTRVKNSSSIKVSIVLNLLNRHLHLQMRLCHAKSLSVLTKFDTIVKANELRVSVRVELKYISKMYQYCESFL